MWHSVETEVYSTSGGLIKQTKTWTSTFTNFPAAYRRTEVMLQAWRVADDVRQACRRDGRRRAALASLRQGQQDVLHQHGANHHFLTVDRQLRRPFLFGHHGDQHQAAAGHRPAGEPVDRMVGRRNRRTEIKAAQIESEGRATEIEEETTACQSAGSRCKFKTSTAWRASSRLCGGKKMFSRTGF